ncbi:hypothetical protein MAR_036211 [Mya arenaria]|uniref:Tyrosine-protein kinase ephrin type A/B receptor-like domain-containing protein n=1 Tax=Mya arenaria TaxID=6604 RepID=A0ABY7EMB2_MYAAR|nr:hypothetical protein MAR_036211 [Mya arenaria]
MSQPRPLGYHSNGNRLPCTAGYIGLTGSYIATPTDNIIGYICPAGYYGLFANPCSPGTYQIQQGQGGKYCGGEALTEPTGPCAERYYCPAADDIGDASPTGYLCPAGSICPANTADPIPCDPGTYQENVGKFECDACPAGYYCPSNTFVPIDCRIYSYCPESSAAPTLCLQILYRCADRGPCQAGHICLSGIGVSDPDNSYLPNGVTTPATCPPNSLVDKEGAISQAECQPCPGGRIYPENSTVSEPCWRGYYCMSLNVYFSLPPQVTMDPAMCPNGTYNDQTRMSDSSACLLCPAGYFCDEEGIANYTTKPCPLGYFCVNASIYP